MKRDLIYQGSLLLIIAGLAFLIFSSTQANLARLGVDSSIDFLWKRAGFEIGQTLIDYDANSSIARAFLVALLNTLLLAFSCIFCASVVGVLIGTSRLSANWLLARLATAYVEVFRNIPALLQIFFWYFVVLRSLPASRESLVFLDIFYLNNRGLFFPAPVLDSSGTWILLSFILTALLCIKLKKMLARRQIAFLAEVPAIPLCMLLLIFIPLSVAILLGLAWDIPQPGKFSYQGGYVFMPEFTALVIGLSMYHASYIAEIVRSSYLSVSRGQTEAAHSLGLSAWQTLRLVIFPQALRVMLPPLTTVYMNLFKGTSLAAAIAYPEIISVFVGTINNLVGQPVIIMSLTLLVYAFVSFCIALFLNWYNSRLGIITGVRN